MLNRDEMPTDRLNFNKEVPCLPPGLMRRRNVNSAVLICSLGNSCLFLPGRFNLKLVQTNLLYLQKLLERNVWYLGIVKTSQNFFIQFFFFSFSNLNIFILCLFVCLYPIKVKTAGPSKLKFFVGPYIWSQESFMDA